MEFEVIVEWGVRFAEGPYGVRWNPSYGHGDGVPYTEIEARDDAKRNGLSLVKRARTIFEDIETEWEATE